MRILIENKDKFNEYVCIIGLSKENYMKAIVDLNTTNRLDIVDLTNISKDMILADGAIENDTDFEYLANMILDGTDIWYTLPNGKISQTCNKQTKLKYYLKFLKNPEYLIVVKYNNHNKPVDGSYMKYLKKAA